MMKDNIIYKQNPSFWKKEPEPSKMVTVYYDDVQTPDDWSISPDVWDELMNTLDSLRRAEEEYDRLMWWEVTQDDKACSERSYWTWEGFAFKFDTIISQDIQDNYNPDLPFMPEILTTMHSPLVNSLPVIVTKDITLKFEYQD